MGKKSKKPPKPAPTLLVPSPAEQRLRGREPLDIAGGFSEDVAEDKVPPAAGARLAALCSKTIVN